MKDKFINNVTEHIINEINFDFDNRDTITPFHNAKILFTSYFMPGPLFKDIFFKYCRNIFGLTDKECLVVWATFLIETRKIIKEKESKGWVDYYNRL